jgi:hypothetical protein
MKEKMGIALNRKETKSAEEKKNVSINLLGDSLG